MVTFKSFTIIHVKLLEVLYLKITGNSLLFIWFEQVPLGHVWVDNYKTNDTINLTNRVMDAIYTAVYSYLDSIADNKHWEIILKEGNFVELNSLLKNYFRNK